MKKRQTSLFARRRAPLGLALIAAAALTACGSSDDNTSSTNTNATVPGAPTIGAATAGNTSASIAFTAPSSDGGAAITSYTGTCTGGGASKTGTATLVSPVSVSGLTNATTYSCSVTATNSVGTGAASGVVSVTPTSSPTGGGKTGNGSNTTGGTSGVACSYIYSALNSSASVNKTSASAWTCNTSRVLTANGIPDHPVGTFPNSGNPNTISEQTVSATFTLTPAYNGTATTLGGPRGATAYVLNGVKVDAGTAGTCPASATATSSCSLINNTGAWSIEALGQTTFNFGTDTNNAHVQPTGEYHYHGMPEGFITLQGGGPGKMTLVGWAADGFPIYARYGYSVATSAASALKVMKGSYRLKTTVSATRPSTSLIPLGAFSQDWEYVAGIGDLDECNGRTGVTPEFPKGIYHYYATDTYPYFQRCVKGTVTTSAGAPPPGGGMAPPPAGG